MRNHSTIIAISAILLGATLHGFSEEAEPYSGGASKLELPEISAIVDIQALSTDAESDPNDNKIRIKEIELGFQGYLNPSVRGDLIISVEQEYLADDTTETELDIEEAHISFLDLPGGLQAQVGRKLMGFGRLNPIHPHHWAFSDTPLALNNLFGDHPWLDDGAELSYLIPNPGDLYLKVSVGIWNGKQLGHAHDHGDEDDHDAEDHEEHADEDDHDDEYDHEDDHEAEEHGHDEVIDWDGSVFTGRAFADLPLTERLSAQLGYSVAGDEGNNLLHGADLVVKYQWPKTYRNVKWHSEWFRYDRDEDGASPSGVFSLLQVSLDKYWSVGGRYDWTELLEDEEQDMWAGSGFLTYHLTHTTYVRGQYQYKEHEDGEEENIFMAQMVWGIGPHSHRLSD